MVLSTAVPRVAVRIALRTPRRPRVGTLYLMVVVPLSLVMRSSISPFLLERSSTTAPLYSSPTSTTASSKGSRVAPLSGSVLVITCGGPMQNSYPSRRMFSMRMVMCRAPRPHTTKVSAVSPGSTRSARLRSSSRSSLSLMLREVTNLPSRPAKGEVLTLKVIRTVGSSTSIVGRGSAPSAMMVSPMPTSGSPAMAQMSPAPTDSTSVRLKLL
mmetsp:Transcript_3022/g.12341  ORF Transcript_3022/g.12341 Transcript_3022/m.12341 type:complete len:213 (-) Transcript_3022:982-1620(-)